MIKTSSQVGCYVLRLVLDIVSKVSIYRNIELSIHRNIERVMPSIPWHPRAFYAAIH